MSQDLPKYKNGFEKLFLLWVCMNSLNTWKGELEVAEFLPSKFMYRQCERGAS